MLTIKLSSFYFLNFRSWLKLLRYLIKPTLFFSYLVYTTGVFEFINSLYSRSVFLKVCAEFYLLRTGSFVDNNFIINTSVVYFVFFKTLFLW